MLISTTTCCVQVHIALQNWFFSREQKAVALYATDPSGLIGLHQNGSFSSLLRTLLFKEKPRATAGCSGPDDVTYDSVERKTLTETLTICA